MKKNVISIILIMAMVIVMFSGCCLRHDWNEASCEAPKTCASCGKTEGEALGHDWNKASCETPKTCASCGKTEGEALGHQIFWTTEDRRTTMEGSCSTCGQTFAEELDWAKLGPCDVVGTWECVDHPEIKVTMNADGTALLEINNETFDMTWKYDSVEDSLMGALVNFMVDTPYGTEKGVLVTMLSNMFMLSIYTQVFTFSR